MRTVDFTSLRQEQEASSVQIHIPSSVGKGRVTVETFASGLQLRIVESHLNDQTVIKSNSRGFTAGVGFCLDGHFESRSACCSDTIFCPAGMSGFFSCPEPGDMTMKIGREPMLYAVIVMENETMLAFMEDAEHPPSANIQRLEQGEAFLVPDVLTPGMRMVFQQIRNCPFTGSIRQLFLEGKLMELLAHKLDQMCSSDKAPIQNTPKIKPADVERVRHAAELLTRDLENPPDMTTLARSVGMSRRSLYRYFHKVNGFSPCVYLRNHRLQEAMQLLQHGEANVTEAAYLVGYSNLSHFAKAFKTMFDILPGEILRDSNSMFT